MAISVKPITLWRREIEDRPGTLADSLAPLAEAGVDVKILMAYRFPGQPGGGAVELFPLAGKRATTAAERGGFSASSIPALLVEGDDAPGLGHRLSRAISEAGINLDFLVAQVIARRYSAVFGFADADGARRAAPLMKAAGRPQRRPTRAKKTKTHRRPR
jgi:hypothetical protein